MLGNLSAKKKEDKGARKKTKLVLLAAFPKSRDQVPCVCAHRGALATKNLDRRALLPYRHYVVAGGHLLRTKL